MDVQVYLAIAATVTKAVDFTRNAFDANKRAPAWLWNLFAQGYGVIAAYASQLSLLPHNRFGTFVTGMAIGAAGSGFHEVFDFFSSKAKESKAIATKVNPEAGDGTYRNIRG